MTKNSFWQLLSLLLKKGALVVIFITISRLRGSEILGQYAFSFALVSAFTLLASVGLPSLVIRETARQNDAANFYFVNVLVLRLLISVAAFGVIAAIVLLSTKPLDIKLATMAFALTIFPASLLDQSANLFTGLEKMQFPVLMFALQWLPVCSVSATLLYFGKPLWTVLLAHVIGFSLASVFSVWLISRNLFKIRWLDVDWGSWWPLLRQSLPLAAATFLGLLYFRIGTILLSFMDGDRAVGWFGAAFHVNEGLQVVPAALMGAALPVLSRQFKSTRDSVGKTFKTMIYYLLMFAFPVATGVTLLSREFSVGLFGPDFGNTSPVLRITIWAIIPIFLNFAVGTLLIAVDKQKVIARNAALCCVLSIGLNVVLIHRLGFIGAAWATLAVEITLLALNLQQAWQYVVGGKLLKNIGGPVLASFAMAVLVIFSRDRLSMFLIIPAAVILYFGVLRMIGPIRLQDAIV